MIFNLAFRNLLRHRKNSLILLTLFTTVVALFFIGNTILAETSKGLERTYSETFTGDLIIKPPTLVDVSLFGATTPSIGEYYTLPSLVERDKITPLLAQQPGVLDSTSLIIGAASLDMLGNRDSVPFFGVDGADYFTFFPGLTILQGEPLKDSQEGVMITEYRFNKIEKETGQTPQIGDPIKLSMYGGAGFKIREVPLVGVFTYQRSDSLLDKIVLTDLQTARVLNSLNLALEGEQTINEENTSLLEGDFLGEDLFEAGFDDLFLEADTLNPQDLVGMVESDDSLGQWTGGGWHFILLKTDDSQRIGAVQKDLEALFNREGLTSQIMGWRQGAGLSAQLVLLLQLFYNGGFFLILLAGMIAMVNILLISVFERTGEIGTLRALGAQKSSIRKLILMENLSVAGTGGLLGVLLGTLILLKINSLNLIIGNSLIQSLLGQDALNITPRPFWGLMALLLSLILGWLATLYPLGRALSIEPSTAQNRGNQ